MKQGLYTVEEVSAMIREGKKLLLASDAKLLSKLPKGDWIGGSSPLFLIHPANRVTSYDKIFVNQLPDFVTETVIKEYDETNIRNIFNDGPQNGFTILIMPFVKPVTTEYAMNAVNFENFAAHPVCGWVSGQPLDKILKEKAYTASGIGPTLSSDKGVAMHISLPITKYAEIHIFNPYEQGDGDVITFDRSGQITKDVYINGVKKNFAEYFHEKKYDGNYLPLVANYSGAMLNISCTAAGDQMQFSAPVFEHIEYRFAKINPQIAEPELDSDKILISFTCVHNFMQPEYCEKYLKKMNGAVVFGEIAYQLLNQTTVYVTIGDVQQNIGAI